MNSAAKIAKIAKGTEVKCSTTNEHQEARIFDHGWRVCRYEDTIFIVFSIFEFLCLCEFKWRVVNELEGNHACNVNVSDCVGAEAKGRVVMRGCSDVAK